MPNKKITVVGDGAEQPLTPEEEHRLEVRVDQMLDPNLPDEPGTAASLDAADMLQQPVAPLVPSSDSAATDPVTVEDAVEPSAAAPTEVVPPAAGAGPKPVTQIVTRFADDDEGEPEAANSVPETEAAAPRAAEPLAAPAVADPPKPAVKKINVLHHDEVATESTPAEVPKPKVAKAKATKAKKSKKASSKKSAAHGDNLESKADAITAAALAAAEQLDATPEPQPVAETVPALEKPEPAAEVADLPTAPEDHTDTAKGAPPLIQKHSAAPIGTTDDGEDDAETAPAAPVPTVGKKISIVDNSGAEPVAVPSDDEITAPEIPDTAVSAAEPVDGEPAVETPDEAAAEAATSIAATEDQEAEQSTEADTAPIVETEPAAEETADEPTPAAVEETKKYRPPAGPIQFKRAEVPIQPYKPGTGPRPAEVDDISSEDAAIAQAFETREPPRPKLALKAAAGRSLKRAVLVVALLLVLAVAGAIAVPSVRNKALALAGVRGDVQVVVLDAADSSPLSGATVTTGGSTGTTDAAGTVTLHQVKLGSQQLTVHKYAFADKSQAVNVAWHAHNSAKLSLTTTGQHYHLTVVDYLSGQPIKGAQVSSGPAGGLSDAKGDATLVAPSGSPDVTVSAAGYTAVSQAITAGTVAAVTLVPSGQDVYIARGSGKLNVYKNTVDGRNEQLVLSGAAASATDLAIAPDASGAIAALVSTRDNTRDASGNLEDSLTLITTATGKTAVVDHADTIKLVDWFGDRLVYVLSKTTTSTTDSERYQLVSYDATNGKRTVLDHATYLNDVLSAKGEIYYATAASGNGNGQFISIKPDGTAKKVVLASEIAAINRTTYTKLTLSSVNKWYSYTLGDGQPTAISTATSTTDRQYADSPNGQLSAYVDTAGSTPKLVLYNVKSGKETQLAHAAGITYPVHWLGNNALVYRVSHGGVVTDNVVSPGGGNTKIITSVSDITGISLWHD